MISRDARTISINVKTYIFLVYQLELTKTDMLSLICKNRTSSCKVMAVSNSRLPPPFLFQDGPRENTLFNTFPWLIYQ